MYMHLILQEMGGDTKPSVELQKYSAERNLAAIENHDEAVQMSCSADRVMHNTLAEFLWRRGYTEVVATPEDACPAKLVNDNKARMYDIRKELDGMADIAVAAMVSLDYGANSLQHHYVKSGMAEADAEVSVETIMAEAFGRVLTNLKQQDEEFRVRTTMYTGSDQ